MTSELSSAKRMELAAPLMAVRLAELSSEIVPLDKQTPEGLRTHLVAEIDKWGKVIKAAGVQAD